jgi:hypothetical protein
LINIHDPILISKRQIFAATIRNINDKNIFFIDETGINLHTSSEYGKSPRNILAIVNSLPSRGRNVSILACITIFKIEKFECILGPYDTQKYLTFIRLLVQSNILFDGSILVADNVAFYKSRIVLDFWKVKILDVYFWLLTLSNSIQLRRSFHL